MLGYAGIIPFLAPVVLLLFASTTLRQPVLDAFLVYAAVILSFLGGIRWGAVTSGGNIAGPALAFSVVPSLWAAACLLLPSDTGSAWGLMTGFVLMGLADWFYPVPGIAAWMRPLRARLTLAVCTCHLLIIGLIQ